MNSTGVIRHPGVVAWSSAGPLLVALSLLCAVLGRTGLAEPLASALEGVVILMMVLAFKVGKRLLWSGAALAYVLLQLFLAARHGDVYWMDFVRAVKPWIYLGLFASCYRARIPNASPLQWVICVIAAAYAVALALGDSRPRILVENNFEIPFVLSVYAALVVNRVVKFRSWVSILVAAIALLSMSRSGIAAYAIVAVMLLFRRAETPSTVSGFSVRAVANYGWFVPVALGIVGLVFVNRTEDVAAIDRLVFLDTFVAAMKEVGPTKALIGAGALTEIPVFACDAHAYYLEHLAGRNGQCYAVVWHASFMRLLHDFGWIGFCATYAGLYGILRSRYSRYDAILGVAPAFAIGFSVGGIYNYFSVLGLLVYFACAGERKTCPARALRV